METKPNNHETETMPQVQWVDIATFDIKTRETYLRVKVTLENGEVKFEDIRDGAVVIENLKKDGVRSPAGDLLLPKDGLPFLEALRFDMKHPQLIASEVRKDESKTE